MLLLPLLASLAHAALPSQVPAAVATGDCRTVVQALEGRTEPDARLLRGRCELRLGQAERAAATLEPVVDGVLGDYARAARADALMALDRAQDVLTDLDGLDLPGRTGLHLRLLRAQALIRLGRSLEARDDLRALLVTEVGDEARFWLAVGGQDRGDQQAALATFRRVWADSTRGPWSDKAAEHLAQLGSPVPDLTSGEGRALVRQRITALDKDYQYLDALKLRRALLGAETPQDPTSRLTLARASFRGKDYPAAVALFALVHGPAAEARGSASDLFDHALAASRSGDYDTAAVLYQRLVDLHATSSKADTAAYKIAYLRVDQRDWDRALPLLDDFVKARPDSKHLDEALWWIGWGRFERKEYQAARAAWARLANETPRSGLVAAARYWTARSHGLQGDGAAERAGLEKVILDWPISGYAWFAADRLGLVMPAKLLAQRPAWPAGYAERPEVQRADTLLALGLQEPARAELTPVAKRLASAGRGAALATAWALIEAGNYREGQALAQPYCNSPWKGGDPVAMQACWPRPAGNVVHDAARIEGVPELVPYGVMITESALDPSVVSLAGARGLMQIMPNESEALHRKVFGDRPWDADLLFDAPYNARLGVAELGEKLKLVGDVLEGPDIVAAIAAYNGGESGVKRWAEGLGGHPEADLFTEHIGYTETRRYVRSVLGRVMAYRWVYGDPD